MPARVLAALALVFAQAAGAQEVNLGTGAVLRGLDKVTGDTMDVTIPNGGSAAMWRLSIELQDCRYPYGNPSGDAYAYLVIHEEGEEEPVFSGWMIASSPALSAMEHWRYDVWLLRCTIS